VIFNVKRGHPIRNRQADDTINCTFANSSQSDVLLSRLDAAAF
jgi:hypothetical protein